MSLRFTKMHALGNDFIVLNAIHQTISLSAKNIALLAQRHTGIGFDQCLIVEPRREEDSDFFYRIYNADGTEVGQCGNGARCLAKFVQYYGLTHKKRITVATETTRMALEFNTDQTVTVELARPTVDTHLNQLTLHKQPYDFFRCDVGNPHAVILSNDLDAKPLLTVGKQLSTHPFFPNQCNIGFMNIISPTKIQCRIYERGCGETQACGSGAVAAVAIGILHHGLAKKVSVGLPGGDLLVHWPDINGPIYLTGDANFVYEGKWLDPSL